MVPPIPAFPLKGGRGVALTFDIDWAPDFMIEFAADLLRSRQIRSTWFVTHRSVAIERLRRHPDLFELGIHPNFLPGSTQGKSTAEILDHCMKLVPGAVSMRSHALVQSTPILEEVLTRTPIKADVSLFLPHQPSLAPFDYRWAGRSLLRVPYFWEDDYEMFQKNPRRHCETFLSGGGLKIFNFHPVHVYLNSADLKPYQSLKRKVPRLSTLTPALAAPFVQKGIGVRTMLLDILDHLSTKKNSIRIKDLLAAKRRKKI